MEEQTRIKICGLTRLEDIDAVNELKPEYVGFVPEARHTAFSVS